MGEVLAYAVMGLGIASVLGGILAVNHDHAAGWAAIVAGLALVGVAYKMMHARGTPSAGISSAADGAESAAGNGKSRAEDAEPPLRRGSARPPAA